MNRKQPPDAAVCHSASHLNDPQVKMITKLNSSCDYSFVILLRW